MPPRHWITNRILLPSDLITLVIDGYQFDIADLVKLSFLHPDFTRLAQSNIFAGGLYLREQGDREKLRGLSELIRNIAIICKRIQTVTIVGPQLDVEPDVRAFLSSCRPDL